MSKWEMVRLGDVCTVVTGTTPSTNNPALWDGNVKWVTPAELSDDSYIIYDTERHISKNAGLRSMPNGTVLLSSRAPIGKVAIAGAEMCCNQGFKNLICSERIYNKYLYRILKSKTEYLNSLGRGATFKEISKGIVENIEIPLPPFDEQQRISDIFNSVSILISQRKQQIEQLDLLVKSRFVEVFGDPVTNPMGWEIGTIRDVVHEVKYGTSRPAVEGGRYKYLRMNNITYGGQLDLTGLKYIDIPDSEEEKCVVQKGDVLFNRTNSKELVGKTCVYELDEPMIIAGYIIRVRTNEKVLPLYLSTVLNSDYGKATLRAMCKSIIGQANINAQELQGICIAIPPIPLQNAFADFVHQTDKSKFEIQQGLKQLELQYSALMQQYFG